MTGADIESVCKKAALLAISELQNRRRATFEVTLRDFEAVLNTDKAGGAG